MAYSTETDEETKERMSLIKELQLSQLLLANIKNEIIKENKKTMELNQISQDIINKNKFYIVEIEKIEEAIKKLNNNNEMMKQENERKTKELKELYNKLSVGEVIPINENDRNNIDEEEDDNNEGFEYED